MAAEPGLFILARPQISVELTDGNAVHIVVTSIAEDQLRVEVDDVYIPMECVEAVAQTLLAIVKRHRSS